MKICFLYIILLFTLFVSCSKDESMTIATPKVITSISIVLSDSSTVMVKFEYNNDWNLIGVKFYNRLQDAVITSHEIEYSAGKIVEYVKETGKTTIKIEHKIDNLGLVHLGREVRRESINEDTYLFTKTYNLIYGADRCLLRKLIAFYNNSETPLYTVTSFEWGEGTLIRKVSVNGDILNTDNILFDYTSYENRANLDLNTLTTDLHESIFGVCALIKRVGRSNEELISTVSSRSQVASGFWSETKYRFEYLFDSELYPIEIKRYSTFSYFSLPIDAIPDEMLDMTYRIKYNI